MTQDIERDFPEIRHAKKRAFLKAYSNCGNIKKAAEAAGIGRVSHYRWLEGESYAAAFEDAHTIYVEALEAEVDRRAFVGIEDVVVQGGRIVKDSKGKPLVKRRYSDNLLMFRLKKEKPEYKEHPPPAQPPQVNVQVNVEQVKQNLLEKLGNILEVANTEPSRPLLSEDKTGSVQTPFTPPPTRSDNESPA